MVLRTIRLQVGDLGLTLDRQNQLHADLFFNISGVGKHSDHRVDAQQSQSR